ncbi:Transcriptional regulator [Candidatus Sulfotelmatobacter sp. SbA7]|jgi:transcriptional regulator with XRE-family HTH domain|nr:Transcriptional regulator [Candidatus Sulfotelmatobacter sp. SbA7]
MNDSKFSSLEELQSSLGKRMRQLRLSRNMDQGATAEKAGISRRALGKLENGRGSTVETLLRTLKALDYAKAIDLLAPEATVNPLALLHDSKPPQRVRRPHSLGKAGV